MKPYLLLPALLFLSTFCLAQQRKQRLISIANYYDSCGNGCLKRASDSIRFKYSGSRGSRFDEGIMDYFNPAVLIDGSLILRQSSIIHPNNVDAPEHSSFIRFDTMWVSTRNREGEWFTDIVETCEYYPDGSPATANSTRFYPDAPYFSSTTYDYRYFYQNLFRVDLTGDDGYFRKYHRERFIIRDADGNVALDSFGMSIRYEYDLMGRYILRSGGYWRGGYMQLSPYRYQYEYYPDNRVRKITELEPDSNGSFHVSNYDTFTYRPDVGGYITRKRYSAYPGGTSFPYLIYEYNSHINASGLKDTVRERTIS